MSVDEAVDLLVAQDLTPSTDLADPKELLARVRSFEEPELHFRPIRFLETAVADGTSQAFGLLGNPEEAHEAAERLRRIGHHVLVVQQRRRRAISGESAAVMIGPSRQDLEYPDFACPGAIIR